MDESKDFKIPTESIPKCPVCGEEMDLNLRKDNSFVEDEKWHKMNDNYMKFLNRIDGKIVFMEFGVGYNTPGIIRYPFEQMTYNNDDITLIRFNKDYPQAIPENKDKTISFDENIEEILDYWLSRIKVFNFFFQKSINRFGPYKLTGILPFTGYKMNGFDWFPPRPPWDPISSSKAHTSSFLLS